MATEPDWLAGGRRQELAQRRIRSAARRLLAERGVEGFTAEAVARRAGCSRATLYRMSGGTKALLDTIVAESGTRVVDHVRRQVDGLAGAERVETAIAASVEAIRDDPALHSWLIRQRDPRRDAYLGSSTAMAETATLLSGSTGLGPEAGPWLVRVVLTLITWPLPDLEAERRLIATFVLPAFTAPGPDPTTQE